MEIAGNHNQSVLTTHMQVITTYTDTPGDLMSCCGVVAMVEGLGLHVEPHRMSMTHRVSDIPINLHLVAVILSLVF